MVWGKQHDGFVPGKEDGAESPTRNQICFHKHHKKERSHLENIREKFPPATSAR